MQEIEAVLMLEPDEITIENISVNFPIKDFINELVELGIAARQSVFSPCG